MKTRITLTFDSPVPDDFDWESVLGLGPVQVQTETQSVYLATFDKDYYRHGSLHAAYLCNEKGKAMLEAIQESGTTVHLGEVLGKHSDVSTSLTFKFEPGWADAGRPLPEDGYRHVSGLDPVTDLFEQAYDDCYDLLRDQEYITPEQFLAWCRGENIP